MDRYKPNYFIIGNIASMIVFISSSIPEHETVKGILLLIGWVILIITSTSFLIKKYLL